MSLIERSEIIDFRNEIILLTRRILVDSTPKSFWLFNYAGMFFVYFPTTVNDYFVHDEDIFVITRFI